LTLVSILAACGHAGPGASGVVRTATITERDFRIKAPHLLRAGLVRLVVENRGPVSHELILVRVPPGGLPMRSDGLTIDEEALKPNILGALEPEGPGASRELQVRLVAGRYLLFCNMAGHYMSGMSAAVKVA
jgi:uncharacterized cupredoxin-like copper-binding protein